MKSNNYNSIPTSITCFSGLYWHSNRRCISFTRSSVGTSTRSAMLSYVLAGSLPINQLPTCIIIKVRQCPCSALQLSSSLYGHYWQAVQPGFSILTSLQVQECSVSNRAFYLPYLHYSASSLREPTYQISLGQSRAE